MASKYNIQTETKVVTLDLIVFSAKYRKKHLWYALAGLLLSLIISLMLPNIYTATASIMPPQQSQSSVSAIMGQLGVLAGAAGGAMGLKTPDEMYIAMLQSRTVLDNIVQQFNLKKIYKAKTETDAREELLRNTKIASSKGGIISINVDDKDPRRAAKLANDYVKQLISISQRLAVTEATRRRVFFEAQLEQAKENLSQAELALKNTQENTGIIQLQGQAQAIVSSISALRAQIAAKEVRLDAMKSFATVQNPEYRQAEAELNGLKSQLAKMEKKSADSNGNILIPTRNIPESALEYERKLRDVKYNETLFEVLAKQYEAAKLDEAKEGALIQVLDTATVPEKKSHPKRLLIIFVTTLAFIMVSILIALIKEERLRIKNEPII